MKKRRTPKPKAKAAKKKRTERIKPGPQEPPPQTTFGGKPRGLISKKECIEFFSDSPKLVDRMLRASRHGDEWLKIVINKEGKGGSRTRVAWESVQQALKRLEAGEEPPLLPSELRQRTPFKGARGTISEHGKALLDALFLLPKNASKVVMEPGKKMLQIKWADGCSEFVTVVTGRGRKTRTINVRFARSGDTPSPLEGYRCDGPDDVPP